jgi:hypothetical protein
MRILILPSARDDLADGFEFYERQGAGLGDYFQESLFSDVESLRLYAGTHAERFGYHRLLSVTFHPGHVRKLLKESGFSVQRPRKGLAQSDPALPDRWQRYTYPRLKKTADLGAALLFAGQAGFRQDPTLYQT